MHPIKKAKIDELFKRFAGVRLRNARACRKFTEPECHPELAGKGGDVVIFDVGAHFGQTSFGFRSGFPEAEIHAFEPVAQTFAELEKVAAKHRIRAHRMAMGNAPGEAEILLRGASGTSTENSLLNTRAASADEGGEVQRVEVDTIDRFCGRHGIGEIDVLKVDAEGFDLQVLAGAEGMIREGKVGTVITETSRETRDSHVSLFEMDAYLRERGYELYSMFDVTHLADGSLSFVNLMHKRVGTQGG